MSWKPVDLSEIVEGLLAGTLDLPKPTAGKLTGGTALFYPGCINGIAGESGSGKSWTALACALQELRNGDGVVFIDYEDHAPSVVGRLLAMGGTAKEILGGFIYVNPGTRFDQVAASLLRETLEAVCPSLIVIDSTGEALALEGANPNADEEVAAWFSKVKWIAAESGAAVVVLDHTAKAGGDEGLWPIGSQRKRASITGAQYMQRRGKPFSRDKEGSARLICAKDRHGHYTVGQTVAELRVVPSGNQVTVELAAASATVQGATWRPTGYMERVSLALELSSDALTGNGVCERVSGKKAHVLAALSVLVAEGYVATAPGARNATLHTSVKAYREADEAGEPVAAESGALTGSTGSGSLGGEPGNQSFGQFREPVGNQSGTAELLDELADGFIR